jgi:hypothetical protein
MSLDQLARRYADEIYARKLEEIIQLSQAKLVEIRRKYTRGYPVTSGFEIGALAAVSIERTSQLAQARADSLIAAYEKAGVAFDEEALQSVTAEVVQLCAAKLPQEIGFIARTVQQAFGNSAPSGLESSVAAQIERGINSASAKISRDLRIRRHEIALSERKNPKVYAASLGKQWDVFLSHASEDRQEFVDPLAKALTESGLSVWYDKTALTVGDNLRRAIDTGLASCRFGVVILSHNFFAKQWPQQELDGLVARQVEGVKVVLPVWHRISAAEVRRYSPILAGLVAANSDLGLERVVEQLREAMGLT